MEIFEIRGQPQTPLISVPCLVWTTQPSFLLTCYLGTNPLVDRYVQYSITICTTSDPIPHEPWERICRESDCAHKVIVMVL